MLTADDRQELAQEVAGLPTQVERESEEAKRFDLLMLNLQLSMLKSEPAYERLRDQVIKIAVLLEEKRTIPVVDKQMGPKTGRCTRLALCRYRCTQYVGPS